MKHRWWKQIWRGNNMGLLDKITSKIKPSLTKASDNGTVKTDSKQQFNAGVVSAKDIIAPGALEVDFDYVRIDNKYYRTLFAASYPRFVDIGWMSSLINFDATLNVSMFVFPQDGKEVLDDLRRKITEMEAEMNSDVQKGKIVNPATQAKLEDALNLQADLVRGQERFFQFGLYITISAESVADLNKINKNLEATLGALMINTKRATLQMEDGFKTTLPICSDKINILRNMDTTSLATTFPFVSSDLSDDKGIMYGINEHNGSLVIFDRFSMPNYNSVVFATAGAGKSYLVKLEALRSVMMGTDIIIVDPENEYRDLAEAVGGQYIAFGYNEDSKINPFDLSLINEEGENALNTKALNLNKLFKVMLGAMDPMEEAVLDKAIMEAYRAKGITVDPETQKKEAPLIEDVYKALLGNEDEKSKNLGFRLEKFIKGSFAGIFNQKTTVNLKSNFVVFGIKNLEESLRPVAMQIILDYIWTVVKKDLRRRIMIVDEAWYMMKYPDSAEFLRGIVKRGRKYYLGVTTVTQDVDDFLKTEYGKEIVTNSSIQILLKQHSAAIDQIGEVFYLSEGEKQLLLTADKGEGIFFAGPNHVAIRVIASDEENKLITSNPEELMKIKKEREMMEAKIKVEMNKETVKPVLNPSPPTANLPLTGAKDLNQKPIINNQTLNQQSIQNPSLNLPSPLAAAGELKSPSPAEQGLSPLTKGEPKPSEEVVIPIRQKIQELEEKEKVKLEEHKKTVEDDNARKIGEFKENKLDELKKLIESANKVPPMPSSKPLTQKPIFINQTPEPKIPQPPQLQKKTQPVFQNPSVPAAAVSKSPSPRSGGGLSPLTKGEQKPVNSVPLAKIQLEKKAFDAKTGKPIESPSAAPTASQSGGQADQKPAAAKAMAGEMDYDKLFGDGIV